MEIGKVGINHCGIAHTVEHDAALRLIVGGAVQPASVEDDVICCSFFLTHGEIEDYGGGATPRDLKPDEPIVAGAIQKNDWSTASPVKFELRHHIRGGSAIQCWTRWQRRNPGIAGRDAITFRRQTAVRCACPHDDPVIVIAALSRKIELATENSSRLQLESIATLRTVQSLLEISSTGNKGDSTACWSAREVALDVDTR